MRLPSNSEHSQKRDACVPTFDCETIGGRPGLLYYAYRFPSI